MILLDTNVVSETLSIAPNQLVVDWVDAWNADEVFISAMTIAELLFGLAIMADGERKSLLTQLIEERFWYFDDRVLPFDQSAAQNYALLSAERRKVGRPISPQDAIIAAVALTHNLNLVTRNVKDFEGIAGLKILNPWEAS